MTQAGAQLREAQWAKAEVLLKEAIILDPACHPAANRLAVCWLLQGRIEQGTALLEKLTREIPNEPSYWMNLGHARLDKMGGELRNDQLVAAQMAFRQAVRLDSTRSDGHLMIAEIFLVRRNLEGALASAEDALRVHGGDDLDDLDAHLLVVWINLLLGRREPMKVSIKKIEEITRGEPEAAAVAADSLARMADAARGGILAFPRELLEAARRLAPHDLDTKSLLTALVGTEGIESHYARFRQEPNIPANFRQLVDALYGVHTGAINSPDIVDQAIPHLEAELAQFPHAFTKAVELLRSKYPPLYRMEAKLFDEIGSTSSEAAGEEESGSEITLPNITLVVGVVLLVVAVPTLMINPLWAALPATLGFATLIVWSRVW